MLRTDGGPPEAASETQSIAAETLGQPHPSVLRSAVPVDMHRGVLQTVQGSSPYGLRGKLSEIEALPHGLRGKLSEIEGLLCLCQERETVLGTQRPLGPFSHRRRRGGV